MEVHARRKHDDGGVAQRFLCQRFQAPACTVCTLPTYLSCRHEDTVVRKCFQAPARAVLEYA